MESKLYIDGSLLLVVTECHDLGVTVISDLSMSKHTSVIVACKCYFALFCVKGS